MCSIIPHFVTYIREVGKLEDRESECAGSESSGLLLMPIIKHLPHKKVINSRNFKDFYALSLIYMIIMSFQG